MSLFSKSLIAKYGRENSRGLFDFGLTGFLQPLVQFSLAFRGERRLNEVNIEQCIKHVERPLCLARLNVHDFAGNRAFRGMCRKISDVPNCVKLVGNGRWQTTFGDGLVNLMYQISLRCTAFILQHRL